jgi:hypothetical protein
MCRKKLLATKLHIQLQNLSVSILQTGYHLRYFPYASFTKLHSSMSLVYMYFRLNLFIKDPVNNRCSIMRKVISCITAEMLYCTGTYKSLFSFVLYTLYQKIFEGNVMELIKLSYQFIEQIPFEKITFAHLVRKFLMF